MEKKLVDNLLYKELSYQVHGAAIEVRKDFGPGHKEKLYQDAFAKELDRRSVAFQKEPAIKIYAPKDGKYVGLYRPDFIADEKIIVETKAEKFVRQDEIKRVYDYLRNSRYELAYLINFASQKLFVRRIIFTNDRKPFNKPLNHANTELKNAKRLLVSIGLLLVLFSGVRSANAASLYFTIPRDVVFVGEDFDIALMLDPEGETLNAVAGKIRLPKDVFFLRTVRTGNSVVDLWIESPAEKDGTVAFSGIIPGGFQGIREPFSLVPVSGKVLTLSLRARAPGTAVFSLEEPALLLHDGEGTPITPALKAGRIVVEETRDHGPAFAEASAGKQETGDKRLETGDVTPPESFEITITRDPALYNNQWTAIFSTQDKETGVNYYEAYESEKEYGVEEIAVMGAIPWGRAESPYLLKGQGITHHVYIKAVDNTGNIRIAHAGSRGAGASVDKSLIGWTIVGIIITLLLIVFFKQKYATKKH